MRYSQAVRYIYNEARFCNLLNEKDDAKQKFFLSKMLSEKQRLQAEQDAMRCTCPVCFALMPMINVCDVCGYDAN